VDALQGRVAKKLEIIASQLNLVVLELSLQVSERGSPDLRELHKRSPKEKEGISFL